jgi:hypothetical protein
LSLAVWPVAGKVTVQAVRGMLLYNILLAFYLAWLGTAGHTSGVLLWPAATLHGAVAALLLRPSRAAT